MGKMIKAEIATSQTTRGASAAAAIDDRARIRVTIPGTDEGAAQRLLVDLLKLGGSATRKARSKAPSMDAIERRGRSYLESTAEPSKGASWRVRIWYYNQEGEVVACDSDPMSRQAAESLESSMRH